jgi:hypothetical protein
MGQGQDPTAWIALGLSVAALGWNVLQLYIRSPRIGVVMRKHMHVIAGAESWEEMDVIVVNSGAEAASIAAVGIRSEDRSRTLDVQRLRDGGSEVTGPDLPARVEAHDALRWVIDREDLGYFPTGTQLIGYAHRYKAFRRFLPKWRPNPLRLTETVVGQVKG